MSTIIGKSVFNYDDAGDLRDVIFEPGFKVSLTNKELARFAKSDGTNERTLQSDAVAALSTWFNRVNDIELSDMTTHEIKSEIVECVKQPNGKLKRCVLLFTFQPKAYEKVSQLDS